MKSRSILVIECFYTQVYNLVTGLMFQLDRPDGAVDEDCVREGRRRLDDFADRVRSPPTWFFALRAPNPTNVTKLSYVPQYQSFLCSIRFPRGPWWQCLC